MKILSILKNKNFLFILLLFFLGSCNHNLIRKPLNKHILQQNINKLYHHSVYGRVYAKLPKLFTGHINFLLKLKDNKIIFYDPLIGKSFPINLNKKYGLNDNKRNCVTIKDILNENNYKVSIVGNTIHYSFMNNKKELFRITFFNNKLYSISLFFPNKTYVLKAVYRFHRLLKLKNKYLIIEILEND